MNFGGTHMNQKKSLTPQAVRVQVAMILASEGFERSRRMQRFLDFIVEETLAGRADQLGEYAIGISVFDRRPDFEPALDPIVRNDARRLRLKLLEYYRQCGPQPGQVWIEIPKGGYVPVFKPSTVHDDLREHSRRVAVLPFEILSPVPEVARYGRALCLSLTASLTNTDGLEAIAHGYVEEMPGRDAALELRLGHVIQGGVWKTGDRCRAVVNLIRVADGMLLWAREYEFRDEDLFGIPSEIAREVSMRLGVARPYLAMAA